MEKLSPGDPQRIGAYRLLARLGAGGMGHVYLARSERGRTVAVKLVRQELAEQEEFRSRFRQEVQAARRVGGAWTAPVLDADTEAAVPWVATGYVAGPSLQSVVSGAHGPLPERSVKILGAGLAHALKDIHAAGLIHRDLKPSNVLVTIDGPRVIDFGIARALETVADGGLTRTGALVGSPGFMAPEQVRGDRITPACDVFCLGSVLAYAATGALPFGTANSGVHAMMFRIAQEEPDLDELPEGLAELVRDCLAKDPQARPSLDRVLERTGAEDTLSEGGRTLEPWLPGPLVAQLGRHAVQLLDAENPDEQVGAPEAAKAPEAADQGAGTPPPPGVPGAAPPVNHLPTMVSGQTPPPTAPPGPAYGYPQQRPAYGYPQAPAAHGSTPPYGPGGSTPPYGPGGSTPPYGPGVPPSAMYATGPQTPPPPRRNSRSTAALIAVALVVAVGAGATVYAVMKGDDAKDRKGGDAKNGASNAPKTPGPNSSAPASDSPSPSTDGSVPAKFLGTWEGSITNDLGANPRRLTIQQGRTGDTVLSLTADGPTDSGGTYHCVFQGTLESASDGELRIGATDVTVGRPMSSCTPGKPSVVTITAGGRLHRENTDGSGELTYDKAD